MSCTWNTQGLIECENNKNYTCQDIIFPGKRIDSDFDANNKNDQNSCWNLCFNSSKSSGGFYSGKWKNIPNKGVECNCCGIFDTLYSDQTLKIDQKLISANNKYTFILQNDGNAYIYGPYTDMPIFGLISNNKYIDHIKIENKGSIGGYDKNNKLLTIYKISNDQFSCKENCTELNIHMRNSWHTYIEPCKLKLLNDGNLVMYDYTDTPLWGTNW